MSALELAKERSRTERVNFGDVSSDVQSTSEVP